MNYDENRLMAHPSGTRGYCENRSLFKTDMEKKKLPLFVEGITEIGSFAAELNYECEKEKQSLLKQDLFIRQRPHAERFLPTGG